MSKTSLSGKVAIVTGGARGIGRAIAEVLGSRGASVVVNYLSNQAKAAETVGAIERAGSNAIAIRADVSRADDVRRLFDECIGRFGRLDILVNNAATASFEPIERVTEAEFDRIFATNVKGVFLCLQEAVRKIADGGRIVNISSGITILGDSNGSVYSASKGAIEQFTLSAAKELGARGITVNTVSPGFTNTELFAETASPELKARAASSSPLGRIGEPRDIADVIAFLAGDEGRWITGQHIRATGGAV
jgi:3-oxoacyl-[acyl-carrier protein] reductase